MTDARPLAVVTGAARRVGRAIAIELASHGFDLLITYRSSQADAETTLQLCKVAATAAGHRSFRAESAALDLASPAALEAFARPLAQRSHIDALIHNASSYARTPLGTITADQALNDYRVNALAPLLLTQALADSLRRSILPGGGAVICFSDIHVLGRPRKDMASYSMSKAALTQMVHNLARDLAPKVRVNAIAPGVIAWPEGTNPAEIAAYESRIPLQRAGTREDAARLVRFLILEATYLTGDIIRLDGGRWLA